MASFDDNIMLAVNAGSSSVKFALFHGTQAAPALLRGAISDIGGESRFTVAGPGGDNFERRFAVPEHVTAANVLLEWLSNGSYGQVARIAHRVVYGGPGYSAPQAIDAAMLAALHRVATSEPGHLPQELQLIEALRRRFPAAAHIACFDSHFHASMPPVAAMLPIPRRYHALGVRRYGFHGIACASLMQQLRDCAGAQAASGKVVIAHLGGGASVTAIENGCSRDTSMGLTPAGGIMMGKRSGDLDPGLAWYLAHHEQLSAWGFNHMTNNQSGLLGISGTSADLRVLLAHAATDSHAAEAVDMFCYQVRKQIAAMAGAMDGIDTLIFSGGVGANAAQVRARIAGRLGHLGVALDTSANNDGAAVVSQPSSRVCVRVMQTDEETVIARQALSVLAEGGAV